jgi:pimeloyl-ACP methyl ester carboxylesterase
MQERAININHKKLFYRTIGKGPAVVLLHGFGEDGSIWSNQFNSLPDHQMIIPDLPGSGQSESTDDVSMERLAEAIYLLLQSLQVENCVLIGHSMGGYVVLAFAEKYPNYLKGFGLFHSTAYPDTEEKKQTRKKGIQFIHQHGAFEFLKTSIPNLYSPVTKEKNPSLIQEQISNSKNFSAEALMNYYQAMIVRPDRADILKESKVPVLFIIGKYDTAVPLNDSLQQCHLPDASEVFILENSGHMGMREEPEVSNKKLRAYLNDVIF